MANLDTLELTIVANAEKAQTGVQSLITSLSHLSDAITKPYSDLCDFNNELRELSKLGKIKLSLFDGIKSGAKDVTASVKEIKKATKDFNPRGSVMKQFRRSDLSQFKPWQYGPNPAPNVSNGVNHTMPEEELRRRNPGWYRKDGEGIREQQEAIRANGGTAPWAVDSESVKKLKQMTGNLAEATEAVKQQIDKPELYGPPTPPGTLRMFNRETKDYETMTPDAIRARIEAQKQAEIARRASLKAPGSAAKVAEAFNGAGATQGLENTQRAARELSDAAKAGTEALKPLDRELKQKKTDGQMAGQGLREAAQGAREAGEGAEENEKKVGKFGQALQHINRIAKTMIIRTVLKSVIKGFQDAWSNAYAFSKKMGGEFYKNVDRARQAIKNVATNLVKAFAPAIQVVVPILAVISAAIEFLCDQIENLLQSLGLASELFGATAEQIGEVGGESSKAAKNVLAGFDELNVLSTGGGGGGTGTTSPLSKWTEDIADELAALKVIIGESLLAIGLILCFTGHIGPGLGLMVLGAASIASALVVDWETLPNEVKNTIAIIMAAIGGAELAIGTILAMTGHVGIGVALMALGAANLVTVGVLKWGEIKDELEKNIALVTAVVSAASLAVGAILAFTGHPALGVALMAAGAMTLVPVAAFAWSDEMETGVKDTIAPITAAVGTASLAIGAILAFAGHPALGIALMAVGAAGLATTVAISWGEGVTDEVKNQVTQLLVIVGSATLVLGAILAFSGANIPLGVALMAAGGASLATAVALNWESITTAVKGAFEEATKWLIDAWNNVSAAVSAAWEAVSLWFSETFITPIKKAWDKVSKFFKDLWDVVSAAITSAWNAVTEWWGDIKKRLEGKWNAVKNYMTEAWDGIKTGITNAWTALTDWWSEIKSNLSAKWDEAKQYLIDAWDNIKTAISDAWTGLCSWWTDIKENLKGKWDAVKTYFAEVWKNIKDKITSAWLAARKWWSDIKSSLTGVWDAVTEYLTGLWDSICKSITNAWSAVCKWFEDANEGITNAWEAAGEFINKIWTDLTSGITAAWDAVCNWFVDAYTNIKKAWESAGQFINKIWTGLKTSISNAWTAVKKWWTEKVYKKISDAWSKVKTFLPNIWKKVKDGVVKAWTAVKQWWTEKIYTKISGAWKSAGEYLKGIWNGIKTALTDAWDSVKQWWTEKVYVKITDAWKSASEYIKGIWNGITTALTDAWDAVKEWWNTNIYSNIESAWKGVKSFFEGIFKPIKDAWDWICKIFGGGNNETNFTVGVDKEGGGWYAEGKYGEWGGGSHGFASGGFPPKGDLFIANESGPELVGRMEGKTAVANQMQIVDGISKGVRDANREQNELLRRQNELLLRILQKENNVRIGASSALGRVVNQSLEMYGMTAGV